MKKRGEFNLYIHSFEEPVNGKVYNHINFLSFVTGDCNFEKPLAACGYSQGRDDDLDWEQANPREKPSSDPWMPSGKDGDAGSVKRRNDGSIAIIIPTVCTFGTPLCWGQFCALSKNSFYTKEYDFLNRLKNTQQKTLLLELEVFASYVS